MGNIGRIFAHLGLGAAALVAICAVGAGVYFGLMMLLRSDSILVYVLVLTTTLVVEAGIALGAVWLWHNLIRPWLNANFPAVLRFFRSRAERWEDARRRAMDAVVILTALQAPVVAYYFSGWLMAIIVISLNVAGATLYVSFYRQLAWVPRLALALGTNRLTSERVIAAALAVAIFGLLGRWAALPLWNWIAGIGVMQKLVFGATMIGLLYWAAIRGGAWWSHSSGRHTFMGVVSIYALYVAYQICVLLGMEFPSVDGIFQAVWDFFGAFDYRKHLIPLIAGAVLTVATIYGFVRYTRTTLAIASVVAVGLLAWHYGKDVFPTSTFAMPTFEHAAAPQIAAAPKNDGGPQYVFQTWQSRFPRLSANYEKLADENQAAEREGYWNVFWVKDTSKVRDTGIIRLPGGMQAEYYQLGLHAPKGTLITCYYSDGSPSRQYRYGMDRECPRVAMNAFRMAFGPNGEWKAWYAFRWNSVRPEPTIS